MGDKKSIQSLLIFAFALSAFVPGTFANVSEVPLHEVGVQSSALGSTTTPEAQVFNLRILKGNFELGEGFGLGHSSVSGAQLDLSPTMKYFVADHLAVGVSMNLFVDHFGSAGLMGPAFDFYFFQRRNWAFLATQEFLKPFRDRARRYSEEDWTWMARVGAKYFTSQKVSVGLDLVYKAPLNTDPGYRETRLGLQFRIGFFY